MDEYKKNTVSALNQVQGERILRYHEENNGLRVLFAGNSMTIHYPKEDIGWSGCWGMAASCAENDYVHIVMDKILKEVDPNATFAVVNCGEWERNYESGKTSKDVPFEEHFAPAREFDADILVMRIVENCPGKFDDINVFENSFIQFVKYIANGKAKVLLTDGFWRHPLDEGIHNVAKKTGLPLVELGPVGDQLDNRAIGLFWHNGVALHPGDKGMTEMADAIYNGLLDAGYISKK